MMKNNQKIGSAALGFFSASQVSLHRKPLYPLLTSPFFLQKSFGQHYRWLPTACRILRTGGQSDCCGKDAMGDTRMCRGRRGRVDMTYASAMLAVEASKEDAH